LNTETNQKGGVVEEEPDPNNKYNHNFQNRFCGCNCDYDADQQKGTMFQCLGLGTAEEGGCGEDWYHPACVVGLDPSWHENQVSLKKEKSRSARPLETIAEDEQTLEGYGEEEEEDDEIPPPPGFPEEDDFDGFICYKCVQANPWIKRYAGAQGFLGPVFKRSAAPSPETSSEVKANPIDAKTAAEIFAAPIPILQDRPTEEAEHATSQADAQFDPKVDPTQIKAASGTFGAPLGTSRKRKASEESEDAGPLKRSRDDENDLNRKSTSTEATGALNKFGSLEGVDSKACKYNVLPPAPEGLVSLFFKSDFREHLCRCSDCFPRLAKHPQLLEEEEAYEPPVSEDGENADGSTVGSGSLLDRGERALTNMDRVRAIEGVMAYNHLKEKLQPFFKEFAESGKAISAEDIKAHFAKIRGDEEAIRQAGEAAASSGDNRREESGY
jgi:E3 ubiquitin-protein ligase UBR7